MSKDTAPIQEAKETHLKETINTVIDIFEEELKDVLTEEESSTRIQTAKNSILLLNEKAFNGAFYTNYRQEASGKNPAFVAYRPMFYGPWADINLGKIHIKEDELLQSEEALAILFHELTHKFGPEDKVIHYPEPERDGDLVHTTEIHAQLGPLSWVERDTIIHDSEDQELVNGEVCYWEEQDANYQDGEIRLWEAVTDYYSTALLSEIKPDYVAETGYLERDLIAAVADQPGMRQAIKTALFQGDKEAFLDTLENHFGDGSYEVMRKLMLESERIDNEVEDDDEWVRLLKERVVVPFLEYFQQKDSSEDKL